MAWRLGGHSGFLFVLKREGSRCEGERRVRGREEERCMAHLLMELIGEGAPVVLRLAAREGRARMEGTRQDVARGDRALERGALC